MKSKSSPAPVHLWDVKAVESLIKELLAIRKVMLDQQAKFEPWLRMIEPAHLPSAINLIHYMALRGIDMRDLQERLACMGLSSLGRAENHVLASIHKVLGILCDLAGQDWLLQSREVPDSFARGSELLSRNADALFGGLPKERTVRMMVTLPGEAAHDDSLVAGLITAGMDIARINCAHDSAQEWIAMAHRVRALAAAARREVRILMDLGGPKLRTGPIDGGVAAVKIKPERDALGRVVAPTRVGLRAAGSVFAVEGAVLSLGVDATWLERLKVGDTIDLTDARDAERRLTVVSRESTGVITQCERTAYLTTDTRLRLRHKGQKLQETHLHDLPVSAGQLHLQCGDILRVVAQGLGHAAVPASKNRRAKPASIACTLPSVLKRVRKGEHIWFDDGHIGGVVRKAGAKRIEVEITVARDGGDKLAADKGINLPDTRLDLPALTEKDLDDLATVAKYADIVGLSFAQSAGDVRALRQRLGELGASHMGIILKVETRLGFEHMPEMLLAAMTGPATGVMIARGDLAVECGFERLAEVQEEILWACESAHTPVVWATQVLEGLAKTGMPSRAEITDAAMGARAECVMLNKGPHILAAMRTLDDILKRMQAHQSKKRPLMRALKAWDEWKP